MAFFDSLARYQPQALGLLRLVSGYLFIMHGTAKLFHVPYLEMFANVPVGSLFWFAGIIELIVGALLILGLFTRIAGFIGSGEMAFAYFIGHVSSNTSTVLVPILNGGELAVTWCFLFLYFATAGGGAFALDNVLNRNK